jgi:membrane associated rhomboid family serine protease
MSLINDFNRSFQQATMLKKLLYINIVTFVVVQLAVIILRLCAIESSVWLSYLELPSGLSTLVVRPWTILTYMFLHTDVLHILFNMLCLFGFGQLFLLCFSPKQLLGVYLFGGVAGAVVYIASFNIFPYFAPVKEHTLLLGASASIMAIIVAVATYSPNYDVSLFLLGRIKLKYVATITFLISLLSVTGENAGGELAHVGGALLGFWFAKRMKTGKDITKRFNLAIDKAIALFERKPRKFKVTQARPKSDRDYRHEQRNNEEELNRILEKIKRSGYGSLSNEERKTLFDRNSK